MIRKESKEQEEILARSLNIALLPDEETIVKAIELSALIGSRVNTEFELNSADLLPHITIYSAHFPEANIDGLRNSLSNIAPTFPPQQVRLGGFSIELGVFVFWKCERTDSLHGFHNAVLTDTNPRRNGLIMPVLDTVSGLSSEDESDKQTYGALQMADRWNPHLTVTRLSNSDDATVVISLLREIEPVEFQVDRLSLAYLGNHGSVTEIIEEFPFEASSDQWRLLT
jgi:hypothetical protein